MRNTPDAIRVNCAGSLLFLILVFNSFFVGAQINYSANDPGRVPPYNGPFLYGTNMGYYGPSWDNISLSNIAAGNPALNIAGVGSKSFRIPLPEEFVDYWGYDVSIAQYNHYASLGVRDNTLFVLGPSAAHRDNNYYNGCGQQSWLWANMYEPIWDGGANGTPVNENNYYASYIYKLAIRYKSYNKFWEILNEPDYDLSGNAWKNPGQPGNWWENNPSPCDLYNMKAPVFHYIRLLRISYEVIKSVDSTAYITVGGIGYPSFLDAILRNSDNPVDGSVSASYPLKGGAYFDVLSFHNYPMYALKYWDNSINNFAFKRHSDAAAEEFIKSKNNMASVLAAHGYNNTSYPEKHFICTENNIPSREFGEYIGTDIAQRNYIIKALVMSQQNNIRQFYVFTLGDAKTDAEAIQGYELMGLYRKLEGLGPLSNGGVYGQQYKDEGIAFRSTSEFLRNFHYDHSRTLAMALPSGIGGAAFTDATGNHRYVLWAKTSVDKSESASATYSFPAPMGVPPLLYRRDWNYSVTGSSSSIPPTNIALSASPIFLEENLQVVPIRDREPVDPSPEKKFALQLYPNPASNFASIKFTLNSPSRVRINLFDARGRWISSVPIPSQLSSGTHIVPIPGVNNLPAGIYFCRFETDMVQLLRKFSVIR